MLIMPRNFFRDITLVGGGMKGWAACGKEWRKTIRSYTEAQEVNGNSSKSAFVWIDVEAMVGRDRKDLFQTVLWNHAILPRFRFRFRVPIFFPTVTVPVPVPAPVQVPVTTFKC
jgi:hypothetical protein